MKSLRLPTVFLLVATAVLAAPSPIHAADTSSSTIAFSDSSKPGTVRIQLARGDLRVEGTDTNEVTVRSEAKPATKSARKDGLRVLTASSSFGLTEKDNVITLDALSDGWPGGSADFALTVPRGTNIVVQNSFGGDISCSGVAGDLEINSMNGEIRLDDIAGGVVVGTYNGEIRANIAQLHENKPLSFTSMNGEVVLRLPADAKANVRLRTQNGAVLTDFPENVLVTKTENSGRTASRGKPSSLEGHGVLPPEAREAIREATRFGAEAVREAAAAMREAAEAAREGAEAARAEGSVAPKPPASPKPPRAPRAAIPTITGGKLVTGTLNGGGPEISIATMNGNVTLRQREGKN